MCFSIRAVFLVIFTKIVYEDYFQKASKKKKRKFLKFSSVYHKLEKKMKIGLTFQFMDLFIGWIYFVNAI